jgi:hypothetical protein
LFSYAASKELCDNIDKINDMLKNINNKEFVGKLREIFENND